MMYIVLLVTLGILAYFIRQFVRANKKHNKHKNAQTEWEKFEKEHPGKFE